MQIMLITMRMSRQAKGCRGAGGAFPLALEFEHNQIKMLRTRTMRGGAAKTAARVGQRSQWNRGMVGQGRGGKEGQLDSVLDLGFALCAALSSEVQSRPVQSSRVASYQQLSRQWRKMKMKMKNDTKNLSNIRFRRAGQRGRARERGRGNGRDGKQDKE